MSKVISHVSLRDQSGSELGTFDWEVGKGPTLRKIDGMKTLFLRDEPLDREFLATIRRGPLDDTAPKDQRLAVG